ncbi:MAG: efflux RND transporter permease subunit [Thermoplasmatota archaeon]
MSRRDQQAAARRMATAATLSAQSGAAGDEEDAGRGDLIERVGEFVSRNPRKIVAVFLVLFLASLPALYSLTSFLSFYQLLPEGDYYDANFILNQELGADNVMFVLTTAGESDNVTAPAALREQDHILQRFEDVEYVTSTVSLPGLVKTLNLLVTGRYELPPDTPQGNAQLEQLFQQALNLYGEQLIFDNVLSRDFSSGIQLVIMEKGHDLQTYRDWQSELLQLGFELDGNNPYHEQTVNEPISLDLIYGTLDGVTIEEGPFWILAAVVVAVISAYSVLGRRVYETFLALFVLSVAIAVTITVGFLVGVHFTMLTMLLIALLLGVGIDYAMHVIARYLEERDLGYGVKESIIQSARHVGSALFITMVTTVVGFVSLYFSRIQAIGQFGVMVGAGMLTAYLACILLLPAMLMLRDQRLVKKGKGVEADPDETPEQRESRRARLEEELREKQQASAMGRLSEFNQRKPWLIIGIFAILIGGMVGTVAMNGVKIWGGSFIDPPIMAKDAYAMRTLTTIDDTIGIPVEVAVVVHGDMTRPASLDYLQAIEDEMLGRYPCPDGDGDGQPAELDQDDNGICIDPERRDHGILNGMSTPGIIQLLYPSLGIPSSLQDDQWDIDSNGDGDQDACRPGAQQPCPDGIPDTSAALKQLYDRLYSIPTVLGVMNRVVSADYDYGVVRYNFAPAPRDNDLGTDVDNYKQEYADVLEDVAIVQADYEARGQDYPETLTPTGLLASAIEVNKAIIRGNSLSTYLMLVTTFLMIFMFWRRFVPTVMTMIPVVLSIGVQYFIVSAFDYEITYVSLILTGMALGIGIDDAVHLVSRFKEEMTHGRPAREAAVLANSEIGRVLVATTVTTLAPFTVIIGSLIIWAKNTAWMTIPTLSAALFATIFLLPVLLRWHGERWPGAWVTKADLKRAGLDAVPERH